MQSPGVVVAASALVVGCSTTVVQAPAPVGSTELAHVSERVVVDCVGAEERLSCTVRSATRVANRSAVPSSASMEASTTNSREVRVLVDGESVATGILGGELRFSLSVAPGQQRTVSIESDATLTAAGTLWTTSGLAARHPWLGEDANAKRASVRYCPSARGSWSQRADPTMTVYGPARWAFEGDAWQRASDGSYARLIGPGCEEIRWETPSRRIPIYHGGPIAGVGGTFGEGLRMRLGYEAGIGSWLVGALYGETNAVDEIVVVPVAEAVTEAVFVLPSVGAGLGVPVRLIPDTRAGVRGQVTIMWGVGTSFALDYYPTDDALQASLLGQFGF